MTLPGVPRTVDEADLFGWMQLELHCEPCQLTAYLTWPELRRRTRYRKLTEIRERLVCRRCGAAPTSVVLHRDVGRLAEGRAERMKV